MTQIAWVLFATAIAFAAVDWLAVARGIRHMRWVSKPAVILCLIAIPLLSGPSSPQRYAFLAALFFSLVGDIALLKEERWFPVGLAAFLLAHLAYGGGFLAGGVNRALLVYSVVAVGIVSLALGGRILRSILRAGRRGTAAAVSAYLLSISAMVALAAAGGKPLALAGAVLFYASDGLIAWNRFVRPLPSAQVPVIVTYHLGQAGLVLSLVS